MPKARTFSVPWSLVLLSCLQSLFDRNARQAPAVSELPFQPESTAASNQFRHHRIGQNQTFVSQGQPVAAPDQKPLRQ